MLSNVLIVSAVSSTAVLIFIQYDGDVHYDSIRRNRMWPSTLTMLMYWFHLWPPSSSKHHEHNHLTVNPCTEQLHRRWYQSHSMLCSNQVRTSTFPWDAFWTDKLVDRTARDFWLIASTVSDHKCVQCPCRHPSTNAPHRQPMTKSMLCWHSRHSCKNPPLVSDFVYPKSISNDPVNMLQRCHSIVVCRWCQWSHPDEHNGMFPQRQCHMDPIAKPSWKSQKYWIEQFM